MTIHHYEFDDDVFDGDIDDCEEELEITRFG